MGVSVWVSKDTTQDPNPVLACDVMGASVWVSMDATQDPNPEDPLNKEAAEMLTSNPRQFEHQVRPGAERARQTRRPESLAPRRGKRSRFYLT
jgi:ubiquitin-protein ligase